MLKTKRSKGRNRARHKERETEKQSKDICLHGLQRGTQVCGHTRLQDSDTDQHVKDTEIKGKT